MTTRILAIGLLSFFSIYNVLATRPVSCTTTTTQTSQAQAPALVLVSADTCRKAISYSDIENGVFAERTVRGLNHCADGKHYTTLVDGMILRYNYIDASDVDTLFTPLSIKDSSFSIQGYTLSADENFALIWSDAEPIYRHSFSANFWVYDIYNKSIKPLSKLGKQQVATLSPDGRKGAFVRDNNIYIADLISGKEKQITADGKAGEIINGLSDWVYEEEFGFDQAYQWSPSSDAIAFYRFDESAVPYYSMNTFNGLLYPVNQNFKYPKAGQRNSFVQIKVFSLASGATIPVEVGANLDQYIPLIQWTPRANCLAVHRVNRLQNSYQMLYADATTGKSRVIYNEESDRYVDRIDNTKVTFLSDGKRFIVRSEMDGWNHLYLYDLSGKQLRQLTKGAWEVTSLDGVDMLASGGGRLYYTSTERSELERNPYSIDLKGNNKRLLLNNHGTYRSSLSRDARYAVTYFSNTTTPTQVAIYDLRNGSSIVRTLENNAALKVRVKGYEMAEKRFFKFKNSSGVELNGYIVVPADFDSTKSYPLLMTQYSGPGSQSASNKWGVAWEDALMAEGIVVACVDGRGTGFRGFDFRSCTYRNLGRLEMEDQRDAAIYLGGLPYIDNQRIAIFGWSYGGFMALNCILQQADVFKAAIAVAPVTSWRFYDTIYTEIYNGLPQENSEGYDLNSPIYYADSLRGKLFLAHGTADDNVHIQNSYEMISRLVSANKDFELMIYPDKNHGMDPGGNRHHLFRRAISFLKREL